MQNGDLETRGNLSGFITVVMWSASGLLLAMTGAVPAFQLALFTLPFPFLITLGKWIARKEDWRAHFRHPWYVYVLCTWGMLFYTVFWYLGFKYAPPFEANLINYLWPFLILLFAALMLKQSMNWIQLAGSLCAFLGLFFLFQERFGSAQNFFASDYMIGYAFAFAGALVWALYSVLTRMAPSFGSDVIAICCAIAGIPILCLHLALEDFVVPQGLEWVGIIGLMLTRVSYLFWNFAMKQGKISVVVGISYFTPLISSILLIVFQYAQQVGISAILILAGCIALSWDHFQKLVQPGTAKTA